jgi:hypothetical protein
MTVSTNQGSDAFQWLDRHMVDAIDAPDEAMDWVYMLKDRDWPLLEAVWSERPSEWREACAYVFCNGPVLESQRILRMALFDDDPRVASQAADTLSGHHAIEENLPAFPSEVVERIKQVRKNGP